MEIAKVLDLENDGLNMAIDGQFLYIRSKRTMYKYMLSDMGLVAEKVILRKDGKSRSLSICEKYIFLIDFCDLYLLHKDNLSIADVLHLGVDLSSDLGAVRFDEQRAYITIRNGSMAVMDIDTKTVINSTISDSSSWDFCIVGNRSHRRKVQSHLTFRGLFRA